MAELGELVELASAELIWSVLWFKVIWFWEIRCRVWGLRWSICYSGLRNWGLRVQEFSGLGESGELVFSLVEFVEPVFRGIRGIRGIRV